MRNGDDLVATNKQLEDENKVLKDRLEKMEKMLSEKNNSEENQSVNYTDIRPDKHIVVYNLENHPLFLRTSSGRNYEFNKYGQFKRIIYSDLRELIENSRSFAESGRFYIVDKDVVKMEGLEDAYSHLMSKDDIDNIFKFTDEKMIDKFTNTSQPQRDSIASILANKIYNGEKVDLNKVDLLSKVYGKDIKSLIKR